MTMRVCAFLQRSRAAALFLSLLLAACGGGTTSPSDTDPDNSEKHEALTWNGTPGVCLPCHAGEAQDVHASVHYQWEGAAPDMTSGPASQGKSAGAVNSYCINILGNWGGCSKCHAGLGVQPGATATQTQLANIDCLVCHQSGYVRKWENGAWVPDASAMTISLDEAVRTVHKPRRENCLTCHAFAGGGDALKRGDLTWAHAATTDRTFDVHMATTGGNRQCTACHEEDHHRFAGRGSDLRPTDLDQEISCTSCHDAQDHDSSTLNRHEARVACQTCHIPIYAKNASDTAATEATETHRTWVTPGTALAPFHPTITRANNLVPVYRHWNGTNDNANLATAAILDSATGRYPTSRVIGSVGGAASKLYPFKLKTAEQPLILSTQQFLALDTSVYFATGIAAAACEQGLLNMGFADTEGYVWVTTEALQALNHEVSPKGSALACGDCHGTTTRMDLVGTLGYELKGPRSSVCTQCHEEEDEESFQELHNEHVRSEGYDCSECHKFSR